MEYELILQTVRERVGIPDSTTNIGLTADVGLSPKKATYDGKMREQS